MSKRLFAAAAVIAAISLGVASPAAADPSHFAVPVTLDCDNGETYAAVFRGGAAWNVNLDTGSTSVIVPTGYDFHGVLTDPDGNVVFEGHEDFVEKGQSAGRQPNESVCTFDFSITHEDGSTFHAWGTGTMFVTPGS